MDAPVPRQTKRSPAPRRGRRREAGPSVTKRTPRRAARDRGAETRAQLIEAALEVFGRLGYEGASTREIAKAANANLAAIVYHFGGKEALHIAVAEYVAGSIAARIGPTLAKAAGPAAATTPKRARAALAQLMDNFIDVILGSEEAELWARFIVREQLQPTAAFDVIYRLMGGSFAAATRLTAAVLGEPESDAVRLRVFTIMGQVLVFRVAQALVLRSMNWHAVDESHRRAIKRIVSENVSAILQGRAP
jgi:AcrR family transcriptional regulator